MLENAILLIGIGSNDYEVNRIIEAESLSSVKEFYGQDSCFYKAYKTINQIADSPEVYILNLDTWSRVDSFEKDLALMQVDYIVPLNLYLDEKHIEPIYGKNITYTQTLLRFLADTVSTVIMTGKHASNYETLDDFLSEEDRRIKNVTPELYSTNKENLVYVTNNLTGIDFSNAALAAMFVSSDYAEYPSSSTLPEAVFEIDFSDVENNLAFFKNNTRTGVTVENLVNFSDNPLYKSMTVKRILKYFVYHRPDTDMYIGKAYTEYRKVKVVEALESFLDNLVDWIIYKYEIVSATDISSEPGAVDIILRYNIWPKFTQERYTIET